MAVVGALVIGGVSFALGWRLGQNQARDYFGKAAALQPVGNILPVPPGDPLDPPAQAPEGEVDQAAPAQPAQPAQPQPAQPHPQPVPGATAAPTEGNAQPAAPPAGQAPAPAPTPDAEP